MRKTKRQRLRSGERRRRRAVIGKIAAYVGLTILAVVTVVLVAAAVANH
ncbi:hypothetical protein [Glaciihabitans sp. dw_435]|nr:hypothetical protein [Glaciihabitans sp. dw_435]